MLNNPNYVGDMSSIDLSLLQRSSDYDRISFVDLGPISHIGFLFANNASNLRHHFNYAFWVAPETVTTIVQHYSEKPWTKRPTQVSKVVGLSIHYFKELLMIYAVSISVSFSVLLGEKLAVSSSKFNSYF